MRLQRPHLFILSLFLFMFISCGGDDATMELSDNFDRSAMLEDWADLMIIPAFESYFEKVSVLRDRKNDFYNSGSVEDFEAMRSAYLVAYREWQNVSIFDIGKAEEIGLRNFTNIFPTNVEEIHNNIEAASYNLALPSNFDAQGYPALDYLFYGLEVDTTSLISTIQMPRFAMYVNSLIDRLYELTDEVVQDWNDEYREIFIANNGSSANASVDKLVNDFLFYYEKFLRAGKIGIPAGIFSGSPISSAAEAPYSDIYSKSFFDEGLNAVVRFFNGDSYDGSAQGISLKQYLVHIAAENQTDDISSLINNQLALAASEATNLGPSLQMQVVEENTKMLQTYDELQKVVVLFKVDMLQALNIQVDFVDADGD